MKIGIKGSKMIKKMIVISGLSLLLAMQQVSASIPKENTQSYLEKITSLNKPLLTGDGYSHIAYDCYKGGMYDEGLENAKKAIELEPTNYSYNLVGLLYLAKEDLNNALDSFIAANYYDYADENTVMRIFRLKELLGLNDEELHIRTELKFIELEHEDGIPEYDKIKEMLGE